MYDLIIEGEACFPEKPKPIMRTSHKLGKVEIISNGGYFHGYDYNQLLKWINRYIDKIGASTLRWECTDIPFPLLIDNSELKYNQYYNINFTPEIDDIGHALRKFKILDIYQSGFSMSGIFPVFRGLMSKNLIQIKGECYGSFSHLYFQALFMWLEYYLSTSPSSIRLEFWLEYFHTVTSRNILEFMKVLEHYQTDCKAKINAYWYCQEHDIDMIEEGKMFQKDAKLDFEIVVLSHEQYIKMSK